MAAGQKRRMHTVPESYFEAFAVNDRSRRTPTLWRFSRTGEAKLIGVSDAEVKKDIYTVEGRDGTSDTGIEDILCSIEGKFCLGRNAALSRGELTKENWASLARFTAAQLLRTPRFFQLIRDGLKSDGTQYEENVLPGVMLELIARWIPRLVKMGGSVAHNDTATPLLTSDNPAIGWKQEGAMITCGVTQFDRHLIVSCPLTPSLAFVAQQTEESLNAVHAERYDLDRAQRPSWTFRSHVGIGTLPEFEVARLNLVCALGAQRYVYANCRDDDLIRFLDQHFFGAPAPVRARDLKPIGSPIA